MKVGRKTILRFGERRMAGLGVSLCAGCGAELLDEVERVLFVALALEILAVRRRPVRRLERDILLQQLGLRTVNTVLRDC